MPTAAGIRRALACALLAVPLWMMPQARADDAFAASYYEALAALREGRRDPFVAAFTRAEKIAGELPGRRVRGQVVNRETAALRYVIGAAFARDGNAQVASQHWTLALTSAMAPAMARAGTGGDAGVATLQAVAGITVAAGSGQVEQLRRQLAELAPHEASLGLDLDLVGTQAELLAELASGADVTRHPAFYTLAERLYPRTSPAASAASTAAAAPADPADALARLRTLTMPPAAENLPEADALAAAIIADGRATADMRAEAGQLAATLHLAQMERLQHAGNGSAANSGDRALALVEAALAVLGQDPGAAERRLQLQLLRFRIEHGAPVQAEHMRMAGSAGKGTVRRSAGQHQAAEARLADILALLPALPEEPQSEALTANLMYMLGLYYVQTGARPSDPRLRGAVDCVQGSSGAMDGTLGHSADWAGRCLPALSPAFADAATLGDTDDLAFGTSSISLQQLDRVAGDVARTEGGGSERVQAVRQRMVQLMLLRGDIRGAEAEAMRMLGDSRASQGAAQARALMALAEVSLALGEAVRADRLLSEADALLQPLLLPADRRHAAIRALRARASTILGDTATALPLHRSLVGAQVPGSNDRIRLESLSALVRAGDWRSVGPHERWLASLAGDDDSPLLAADAAIVAGEALLERGRLSDRDTWARVRDRAADRFGEADPRVAVLSMQLARAFSGAGRSGDAMREARRAIDSLAAADGTRIFLHPDDPVWWNEPSRYILEHALQLLAPAGQAQGSDADALFIALQLRSGDAADTAVRNMRARLGTDPATDARIRRYEAALADRAELTERIAGTADPAQRPELLSGLSALNAEVRALESRLRQEAPAYWALLRGAPATPADLRRELGTSAAMLHYAPVGSRIAVTLVSQGGTRVRMIDAASTAALLADIDALRRNLELRADRTPPPFDHQAARRIHRTLLAPETGDLAEGTRLVIVPGGPLHGLPFAALVTGGDAGDYLIRRHALVHTASPGAWLGLRALAGARPASPGFLGVGNPVLGRQPPRADEFIIDDSLLLRAAQRRLRSVSELPPLPETETEVRTLARLFNRGHQTLLLDSSASERSFRSHDLAGYDVLSFSTHGLVTGDVEGIDEPGLVLTPPASIATSEDDGFLGASEIATLRLAADWVILAACNTGRSVSGSQATLGPLARAFHYAGARNMLVTHWPVASDATLELVTGAVGSQPQSDKAEALRQASLALADGGRHAHPAYWAAFFLVGE